MIGEEGPIGKGYIIENAPTGSQEGTRETKHGNSFLTRITSNPTSPLPYYLSLNNLASYIWSMNQEAATYRAITEQKGMLSSQVRDSTQHTTP
jgi:hypothetical protein